MNQIDGNDDIDWEDDTTTCAICDKEIVYRDYPICKYCDDTGNEYEDETSE